MALLTSRRFMQSVAGITLATSLTACGSVSAPMLSGRSAVLPTVSGMSAADTTTERRFGVKFDANSTTVKFVNGGINAGVPGKVDLRSAQTPVRDQGRIGSCTGFAIAGLAEFNDKQNGRTGTLSPAFIYTLELQTEGNLGKDEGAFIHDGVSILNKKGIAPEALQPYLPAADQLSPVSIGKSLSTLPSAAALAAAPEHRIPSVKKVADLNAFKAALAGGKPVVFGIRVYESFMSPDAKKTGNIPVPNTTSEKLLGGHAILAVGYDDQKQEVTFKNQWNTTWGDQGYGHLPYGYFAKSLVSDAWQAN